MTELIRKTKRLVVRPLALSDYEAWKEAQTTMLSPKNNWDRKNKSPEHLTLAKFKQVLKRQKALRDKDQFYDLAVFEKASGRMVGFVAVMDVLRGLGQSAYLGYSIYNRHWGQGYGKEAVRAMIDIGFRDIKVHRLEAGIEPENRRSIMLARSLGLRKEGLKKRAVFLQGRWVDLVSYAATSEEFGIKWKGSPQARPR